jgi:hypothetical protein
MLIVKIFLNPRKMPRFVLPLLVAAVVCFGLSACVSVKTEHRVEPIQMTMDVNVRLERELEQSFGALDARSRKIAENHTEKRAYNVSLS